MRQTVEPLSSLGAIPSGVGLGADLVGFDIRNLTPSDAAFVRRAWLTHLVLRVRGQQFDDDDHLSFARLFGEVNVPARVMNTGKSLHERHLAISVISNIKADGKPIGSLGDGELVWHSDMSFIENPPAGSLLHAYELPPSGGDTRFLDMYRVYETLPTELRRAAAGRRIKHENIHGSDLKVRPGTTEPQSEDPRDYPGVTHPIIRTHPETRRPALYLGRRVNAYVVGLPLDESEDLLDRLWAHAEASSFVWTQLWQVGDLIIWDNRCVMHMRDAFDPAARRLMHRVVIGGEKPFGDVFAG